MLDLPLAFLAGLATAASPCILPVLPLVLGASVGSTNPLRPVAIVGGFVASFSVAALFLGILTRSLGLSPDILRTIACVFIALLGVALVWPRPFEKLAGLAAPLTQFGFRSGRADDGLTSALLLGMSLGVIWTPCAGPILAAILTLVASAESLSRSAGLVLAYGVGAGLPMLAIAYGGQAATTQARQVARHADGLRRVFGVLVIAVAAAIYSQYDVLATVWLTSLFT
ncbi:cytochrome c biogenesis CcdA family protein [Phenylobacterium sp.]|uniref:cytochrome c biogenesis CcdA family protein n=1 Tax=Phenylobacterium sp. TaxID=1871053 RepID=UPI00286C7218|nr:cytochrome c biogenesis CcdA family protein [Phenylobacterium sp.]